MAVQRSSVARFEAAAESVVLGDVETLRRLLRDDGCLIRARSNREHRATLLHYVSANGVEGYRQKTPPNIVAISALLLESGAEIDATADVYGGGWTALGLTATSTPPLRAGVQNALLALLADHGADINLAPRGHNLIVECVMNGCPGAAGFLASRGARLNLEAAAAVGRLDAVERLLNDERTHMQRAFLFACGSGHDDVVELLLRNGADLSDQAGTSEAALHWAVMGGHVSTIELLIAHGASLAELNGYGGTPLEQALWSFFHDPTIDHVPAIETLLAAGAEIERGTPEWIERQEGRSASEKARLIEVLRRYGAKA
jgi:ankyrin repeat protein